MRALHVTRPWHPLHSHQRRHVTALWVPLAFARHAFIYVMARGTLSTRTAFLTLAATHGTRCAYQSDHTCF